MRGAISAVSGWLRCLASNPTPLLGAGSFSASECAQLATIANKLGEAGRIATLSDDSTRGGLEEAIRVSLGLVVGLAACGDYCLLPGGWRTPDGGHAVMYAVVREADSAPAAAAGCSTTDCPPALASRRFTFVVLNSGLGLSYHPSTQAGADGQPKLRYRTGLALGGIAGWRLADPSFLFMLLRLHAQSSATNAPAVVCECRRRPSFPPLSRAHPASPICPQTRRCSCT